MHNKRNLADKFKAGDRVRLTGAFLRSTGQFAGGEGQRKWSVLAVDAKPWSVFVVTDEKKHKDELAFFSAEELEKDPTLQYRRINAANLQHCGKPDHS